MSLKFDFVFVSCKLLAAVILLSQFLLHLKQKLSLLRDLIRFREATVITQENFLTGDFNTLSLKLNSRIYIYIKTTKHFDSVKTVGWV